MESEKVKEIKKALEFNIYTTSGFEYLPYENENSQNLVAYADILTLINELESELEKEQINNLNCDTELQYKEKRIAELEKEKTEQLKQFAEKLKDSGVVKALSEIGAMSPICKKIHDEIVKSIDQTLREFIGE